MAPEPGFITVPADVLVKALKAIAGIRKKTNQSAPSFEGYLRHLATSLHLASC